MITLCWKQGYRTSKFEQVMTVVYKNVGWVNMDLNVGRILDRRRFLQIGFNSGNNVYNFHSKYI